MANSFGIVYELYPLSIFFLILRSFFLKSVNLSSPEEISSGLKWAFPLPKKCPVGLSGLEPPTSRLSGVRSNQLSYKPSTLATTYSPTPSPVQYHRPYRS